MEGWRGGGWRGGGVSTAVTLQARKNIRYKCSPKAGVKLPTSFDRNNKLSKVSMARSFTHLMGCSLKGKQL